MKALSELSNKYITLESINEQYKNLNKNKITGSKENLYKDLYFSIQYLSALKIMTELESGHRRLQSPLFQLGITEFTTLQKHSLDFLVKMHQITTKNR